MVRKLRVLHVIPSIDYEDGGPSYAIRSMAKGLSEAGVCVDVATTTSEQTIEPLSESIDSDVHYHSFARNAPRSWAFSRSLVQWLKANVSSYDLLHVHAMFSYPTLAACRIAMHYTKPYIIRPLGALDKWSFNHKLWKKWPYYFLIERNNLRNAAGIHATSMAESKNISRLGYGDKTFISPLSVPVSMRQCSHCGSKGIIKILFMSRLHKKKALPVLLRAIQMLRNRGAVLKLTVAGDGDAKYVAMVKKMVCGLGIDDNVEFVGFVFGRRKDELLASADIFVLPSYHENFGIVVAEAMASGLPVIITDQVALSEEIEKAGAGFVVKTDCPGAIADAIIKLNDSELRREMGGEGIRLVSKNFSNKAVTDNLLNNYVRIIKEWRA